MIRLNTDFIICIVIALGVLLPFALSGVYIATDPFNHNAVLAYVISSIISIIGILIAGLVISDIAGTGVAILYGVLIYAIIAVSLLVHHFKVHELVEKGVLPFELCGSKVIAIVRSDIYGNILGKIIVDDKVITKVKYGEEALKILNNCSNINWCKIIYEHNDVKIYLLENTCINATKNIYNETYIHNLKKQ